MEWDGDYMVYQTETQTLWRLADGDRFGPYMVSGLKDGIPGRVNMDIYQAIGWLVAQEGVALVDAIHFLNYAEDYVAEGGDQCRYSLANAKVS